ncbi:MAG: peptidylprolyl isomerase [Desulfuromonadales bacterium]
MKKVKQGDRVKVNFTGKLDDGMIVDSSEDCGCEECDCEEAAPVEFTMGEEEVIPGLEQALLGMAPGESKTVRIASDEAYGAHDEELVMVVDREEIPAEIAPEVGQTLELTGEDGESFLVTVTEVTDETVVLDGNHPLAGMDINYEIELVEIV